MNNIPLYSKLKSDLIYDIKKKKYKEGDMIPSENKLCEIYNISRPTVRQAIGELTNLGYLYKIKGKGTFVSNFSEIEIFNHSEGFIFSLLDYVETSNRKILSIELVEGTNKILDKKIDTYFNLSYIPNTDNMFFVVRYIDFQNSKKIYCISILPSRYFPKAHEQLKSNCPAINLIGSQYQLDPIHCKTAVYLSNADKNISSILQIQNQSSLMIVESELISRNGNIVEHNIAYYSGLNSKIYFIKGRKK